MDARICSWLGACIVGLGLAGSSAAAAAPALDKAMVVPDPAEPGTVTCGIQEAIDRLPEGGRVCVPAGVHVIQGTIFLKPNTMLTGAGKATIVRKGPGWIQYLAEDVKKDAAQNYVVVKDASQLKPGMWLAVGDKIEGNGEAIIERLEGNKVFLRDFGRNSAYRELKTAGPWKPTADTLVARQGAIYNAYNMIRMDANCVVADLAIDGNKRAQEIEGQALYKVYPNWWTLRCVPYIPNNGILERCKIYDAAGVCVSVGSSMVTIRDCEIAGGYQGIHPGAGPYVRIIGNQIHGNERHGIGACLGNYGMVISQNIVYENGEEGIGWFGVTPSRNVARNGDFHSIISDNVVFRNGWAGIGSGQGDEGPWDFVIRGNIVKDNWQQGCPKPGRSSGNMAHFAPAGICLFNAKRCIITGNRCFDEQDTYAAKLLDAVAAGAVELPLVKDEPYQFYSLPMVCDITGAWDNFAVRVSDGAKQETAYVGSSFCPSDYALPGRPGRILKLKKPLAQAFAKGAEIRALKTQAWGIFVGGELAEGNLIANNQCEGNRVGGILWEGARSSVLGNIGEVKAVDKGKSLKENVYPGESAGSSAAAKSLPVPQIKAPLKPDAELSGAGWTDTALIDGFALSGGDPAASKTLVRLGYDAQALYVGFECADPAPDRIMKMAAEEMQVFRDDAVVILLQPDPGSKAHFQLAISASGMKFDQQSDGQKQDTAGFNPEWQAATRIDKQGWTAVAVIPFAALGLSQAPKGKTWGANFCRRFREGELSSWSPATDWHDVESYGRLTFE